MGFVRLRCLDPEHPPGRRDKLGPLLACRALRLVVLLRAMVTPTRSSHRRVRRVALRRGVLLRAMVTPTRSSHRRGRLVALRRVRRPVGPLATIPTRNNLRRVRRPVGPLATIPTPNNLRRGRPWGDRLPVGLLAMDSKLRWEVRRRVVLRAMIPTLNSLRLVVLRWEALLATILTPNNPSPVALRWVRPVAPRPDPRWGRPAWVARPQIRSP